jgi:hypothetical protein
MNVAAIVVVLVVTMVALGLAVRQRKLRDPAAVLRLLAVAFAAIAAVALFATVQRDSGAFAIWGLGLPVLVTLVPVFAARSRFGPVVTGGAAGFLLVWSLLLALGVGVFLLPAALAETAAAVVQRRPDSRHRNLTGAGSGG